MRLFFVDGLLTNKALLDHLSIEVLNCIVLRLDILVQENYHGFEVVIKQLGEIVLSCLRHSLIILLVT